MLRFTTQSEKPSASVFGCGVGSGSHRRVELTEVRIAWGTARGDLLKCARILGYSRDHMRKLLRDAGIEVPSGHADVTADWNPAHIAALRRAGATFDRIAKLRGVSRNTVWKFCRKNGIA